MLLKILLNEIDRRIESTTQCKNSLPDWDEEKCSLQNDSDLFNEIRNRLVAAQDMSKALRKAESHAYSHGMKDWPVFQKIHKAILKWEKLNGRSSN